MDSSSIEVSALYDRFAPALYRYIYHRLGSKLIAEDLTAEVFVRVLKMQQTPDDWRAYLYRIAHNLVVDYLRRNPSVLESTDELMPAEQGDPVEHAERADERHRLRRAIARLTPEQQQVVVLKFIEEMSNAEISKIMRKPEGAVKALQHRALANLRLWLREPPSAANDTGLWNLQNERTEIA